MAFVAPPKITLTANDPIDLVDQFILWCKEVDPELKSIEIDMKGTEFNRTIKKTFEGVKDESKN